MTNSQPVALAADERLFDINAPMDAPIRAREARERREHEEAMKEMQSPEFQKKLRKVLKRTKSGAIDKRFGPRMGPPR